MHSNLRERARSEGGFTLIELLVVMIIIAILMAVAVPTFLAQKNNAQKSKATSNIKQIVNAIESCAANNTDGTYTGVSGGTNCTLPSNILTYEKSLNSLNPALAAGATPAVLGYSVLPISTQGYRVSAAIKDGDYTVHFVEIHREDGSLSKVCRAAKGTAVPAIADADTDSPDEPNSRTCTNGTWG